MIAFLATQKSGIKRCTVPMELGMQLLEEAEENDDRIIRESVKQFQHTHALSLTCTMPEQAAQPNDATHDAKSAHT